MTRAFIRSSSGGGGGGGGKWEECSTVQNRYKSVLEST